MIKNHSMIENTFKAVLQFSCLCFDHCAMSIYNGSHRYLYTSIIAINNWEIRFFPTSFGHVEVQITHLHKFKFSNFQNTLWFFYNLRKLISDKQKTFDKSNYSSKFFWKKSKNSFQNFFIKNFMNPKKLNEESLPKIWLQIFTFFIIHSKNLQKFWKNWKVFLIFIFYFLWS